MFNGQVSQLKMRPFRGLQIQLVEAGGAWWVACCKCKQARLSTKLRLKIDDDVSNQHKLPTTKPARIRKIGMCVVFSLEKNKRARSRWIPAILILVTKI